MSSTYKDTRKSRSRDKPGRHQASNTKWHGKREKTEKETETKSREAKQKKKLQLEAKKELKREKEKEIAQVKVKKKAKEKEDGEVTGEDSGSENELPICRFHSTNSCTWGSNCRFRHPGSKVMGNYVMFESLKLPLLPKATDNQGIYSNHTTTPWLGYPSTYPDESDSSFDQSLRDLKQMMQFAGYKVDQYNAHYVHKPWIEFNDLDTDPYYTNEVEWPASHASLLNVSHISHLPLNPAYQRCRPCLTDPFRKITFQLDRSPSSSSTSDYTTTSSSSNSSSSWCSSSRSTNLRKRKFTFSLKSTAKRRKGGAYSSSHSSDSISYESSTHSSELSSSSADDFNAKYDRSSYKKKRYKRTEFDQRKRRYLERKLKYVEDKISRKERKL